MAISLFGVFIGEISSIGNGNGTPTVIAK